MSADRGRERDELCNFIFCGRSAKSLAYVEYKYFLQVRLERLKILIHCFDLALLQLDLLLGITWLPIDRRLRRCAARPECVRVWNNWMRPAI